MELDGSPPSCPVCAAVCEAPAVTLCGHIVCCECLRAVLSSPSARACPVCRQSLWPATDSAPPPPRVAPSALVASLVEGRWPGAVLQSRADREAATRRRLLREACETGSAALVSKALAGAGEAQVAELLGAPLGADGLFPLHVACRRGNVEAARALAATGRCDVDAVSGGDDGDTPLGWAAAGGHAVLVRALLAGLGEDGAPGADVDRVGRAGGTPLLAACAGGHGDVVAALLGAGAKPDGGAAPSALGTPLQAAAGRGDAALVGALLEAGATDPRSAALHAAAAAGAADAVRRLVREEGCDVNRCTDDEWGTTALWLASDAGHAEAVRALAEGGASVNKATEDDGTPPLWAACQGGHDDVVQVLLAHGADANRCPDDGERVSPLWKAVQKGHAGCVALLLRDAAGVEVDAARAADGSTPLYTASQDGRADLVAALLAAGADADLARTDFGTTPLLVACERGHEACAVLLVSAGADVARGRSDVPGITPLALACRAGLVDLVGLLLDHGARPNQDPGHEAAASPMKLALLHGNHDVVRLLLAHGATEETLDDA